MIDIAKNILHSSNENHLCLSVRRKLMLLLGDYDKYPNCKILTKGKRYRAILALRSVEKIMDVLSEPLDIALYNETVCCLSDFVVDGIDPENLKTVCNELHTSLDNFDFTCYPIINFHVGWMLLRAIVAALVDEEVLSPIFENSCDNDIDPFTWDTAYAACKVYEMIASDNGKNIRECRRQFWLWYIDEI